MPKRDVIVVKDQETHTAVKVEAAKARASMTFMGTLLLQRALALNLADDPIYNEIERLSSERKQTPAEFLRACVVKEMS
jgi:hypothetical protein